MWAEGHPIYGEPTVPATTTNATTAAGLRAVGSALHAAFTRETLVIWRPLRHSRLMCPMRLEHGGDATLGSGVSWFG